MSLQLYLCNQHMHYKLITVKKIKLFIVPLQTLAIKQCITYVLPVVTGKCKHTIHLPQTGVFREGCVLKCDTAL